MNTLDTHIVALNNLSIGYGTPLLSPINAEINKGEIVFLAGKNGSGKTTLLKSIFKELPILQGEIRVNQKNISDIPFSEIGKQISVVLSKSLISSSLKVFDLIALGRYPYKKWYQKLTRKEVAEIEELIVFLQLEKYKNYYIDELSDGNLQKVLIARALIQDCSLLILDEPTSYLDIANKLEIMNLLKYLAKEKEKTILFTSHDLSLGLAVADKIWVIKENKMIAGFTEDVAGKENILDYFGGKASKFNYESNEYDFLSLKKERSVAVQGNTKNIFWLKKSLHRNGFVVDAASQVIISDEQNTFKIIHQKEILYFDDIQNVILYLKNHENIFL